jgi:hypothetical protein
VGSLFATVPALITVGYQPRPAARHTWSGSLVATVVALLFLLPASVSTIMGMANPNVGYEETQHLGYIFFRHPTAFQKKQQFSYADVQKMADYFAARHTPDGQIVVDNFSGCVPNVIVASPNPDIFVIPNDQDFEKTLADPLTWHAHYILDVDPTGDGALTAPNITFPNLWATGDNFARVVYTFPAQGECPEFRLFKVYAHPNQDTEG